MPCSTDNFCCMTNNCCVANNSCSGISRIAILTVVFLGILLLVVSIVKNKKDPPQTVTEYVHVPVTTDGEQAFNTYPSDIFQSMFSNREPWAISNENFDRDRQSQINRYFVNQG